MFRASGSLISMRTGRCAGRGNVAVQRVVHHHTIRIETPAERADRSLHALDPTPRNSILIALIIEWNHFIAQDAVEIFGISRIMNIRTRVSPAVSDRETVQTVVGFSPPSIENRKIKAAIQNNFLTACARSFQRTPRIVQPDIDAAHQVASDIDVVVLDKYELVGELP